MSSQKQRYVMGKNCVKEVIAHERARLVKIFVSSDSLIEEMKLHSLPFKKISKEALNQLVQSESHQQIAALVWEKEVISLKDLLLSLQDEERACLLFLDSIFDPQNLGAILRCADCFGVDAVIWSKNRGVGMTPVVSKASVGASEILRTIEVSNLVTAIKQCQEEGFLAVTAEVSEKATSLYNFHFPEKVALIVGSEGKGVRRLTSEQADISLKIPMYGMIDSLNVSQATAVILSHWKKQNRLLA